MQEEMKYYNDCKEHSHMHHHDHEHSHVDEHTHEHTHDGETHVHEHHHEHTHMHDHSHKHDHSHTHDHNDEKDPMVKVVALLDYMANHNSQHASELADMGKMLRGLGKGEAADKIAEGVAAFEEANGKLSEALNLIKMEI